jgi:thymidylate kinase
LKIVILGPDGAGKSSVIQALAGKMKDRGCAVSVRHLKPQIIIPARGGPQTVVTDPHGKPLRSSLLSLVKILIWLIEEWFSNIFLDNRNTILLCDRYFHDLLVDIKRYRYGGPMWAARLVGTLMPPVNLWILLDAPAEVLQARKQEVPLAESARQRLAYLKFVSERNNSVIIDASQHLDNVIREVEQAVTIFLCKQAHMVKM